MIRKIIITGMVTLFLSTGLVFADTKEDITKDLQITILKMEKMAAEYQLLNIQKAQQNQKLNEILTKEKVEKEKVEKEKVENKSKKKDVKKDVKKEIEK